MLVQIVDPNEGGDWKGLDKVLTYIQKRRAVLKGELPVSIGEVQGDGACSLVCFAASLMPFRRDSASGMDSTGCLWRG